MQLLTGLNYIWSMQDTRLFKTYVIIGGHKTKYVVNVIVFAPSLLTICRTMNVPGSMYRAQVFNFRGLYGRMQQLDNELEVKL